MGEIRTNVADVLCLGSHAIPNPSRVGNGKEASEAFVSNLAKPPAQSDWKIESDFIDMELSRSKYRLRWTILKGEKTVSFTDLALDDEENDEKAVIDQKEELFPAAPKPHIRLVVEVTGVQASKYFLKSESQKSRQKALEQLVKLASHPGFSPFFSTNFSR